jgi:hypothetical protein
MFAIFLVVESHSLFQAVYGFTRGLTLEKSRSNALSLVV